MLSHKIVMNKMQGNCITMIFYGVLQYLRIQNPILFAYIRKYKYFQFLNEEGQIELDKFIDDAMMMMMGYDDWNNFELDYCTKYKLPIQGRLL